MKRHINPITFGIATVCVAGMLSASLPTLAQEAPGGTDQTTLNENKLVTLDLEGVDLYQGLTLLFKQAKVQYSLDNSLRGTLVTMHVKQPFKRALEAVLKASGLPITYQYVDGVYSVIPIVETPETPIAEDNTPERPKTKRFVRIPIYNLNAIDIASFLGGRILHFVDAYSPQYVGFNPFAGGMGMSGGGGGNRGGGAGGFGNGAGAGGLGNFGGGLGSNTFANTGGSGNTLGGVGGRGL